MNPTPASTAQDETPAAVAPLIFPWWDANRRELAWRAAPGEVAQPYRVWLSEILLQQTTTVGAAPYFQQFVTRWPNVEALAAASLETVMQVFAGLGYYSRARNLHACAKAIVAAGGAFPDQEQELRKLPGIGAYTAAAIAAIAFERLTVPVDGNIARVISRIARFERPIAANRAAIDRYARAMTPPRRPGDFAQALMDLGAMVCRPRNPLCGMCPLESVCLASRSGRPEDFPARSPRKERPVRVGAAFYAERADGAFLARRRPPEGLLGSTMELPGSAWIEGAVDAVTSAAAPCSAPWRRASGYLEHVFTHFTLRLAIFSGRVDSDLAPERMVWIGAREVDVGFSTLMQKAIGVARQDSIGLAQQELFPLSQAESTPLARVGRNSQNTRKG